MMESLFLPVKLHAFYFKYFILLRNYDLRNQGKDMVLFAEMALQLKTSGNA